MVYSPTNNVLASLASPDAEALRPHMKSIDLRQGAVVGEPGKTIDRVGPPCFDGPPCFRTPQASLEFDGPHRSVHMSAISSSWALHETSSVPLATDKEPYLAQLAASSWITNASVVLDLSPTFIFGTETRMRTLAPCSS
jgi:hypothetical protein